jgi:hypothetical protein
MLLCASTLDGNVVEVLTAAYRLGELTVTIRGRPVSKDALNAIFFGTD